MFSEMIRSILKLRWALYRKIKIIWEKLNGLDFTRSLTLKELGFTEDVANIYSPSNTADLVNVLEYLEIQPSDSILDYGAGKGSAMVTMSKYKFKKVDGVELSQPLCRVAKRNFEKLGLTQTAIFHCDARDFLDLDIYTHFYFFNPFPGNILKLVIQNIKNSFARNPRKLKIIYYLPAFQKVIEEDGFFKEIGQFETQRYEMKVFVNKFDD